jgi:molybdate transport system regulatory protein
MPMRPKQKLFISSHDTEGVFGDGKYRLLKAVEDEGSIQRAAARLGRSYRKAWGDIKRAEEGLGRSVVSRSRGGAEGGATVLTQFGHDLLRAWEAYREEMCAHADGTYDKYLCTLTGPRAAQGTDHGNGDGHEHE